MCRHLDRIRACRTRICVVVIRNPIEKLGFDSIVVIGKINVLHPVVVPSFFIIPEIHFEISLTGIVADRPIIRSKGDRFGKKWGKKQKCT